MLNIINLWPRKAGKSRSSSSDKASHSRPSSGSPSSTRGSSVSDEGDGSSGGTRDGRKKLLIDQVIRYVARSPDKLNLLRVKGIAVDVSGFEFVLLLDLEVMPTAEVAHLMAIAITRRAKERLGLGVKAVYWRGVAPAKPAVEEVSSHRAAPSEPRPNKKAEPAEQPNDFALSSPADLHLMELGLSRPTAD